MSELTELPAPLKALLGGTGDSPVKPEHIRDVMRIYGERLSAGDAAGTVALFAEDAIVQDPITAPPRPASELKDFFQGAFDAQGGFIEMVIEGNPRIVGNYGAACYQAVMTIDGHHVLVETLDVMQFNDSGLIKSMQAYWGPATVKLSDRAPKRLG